MREDKHSLETNRRHCWFPKSVVLDGLWTGILLLSFRFFLQWTVDPLKVKKKRSWTCCHPKALVVISCRRWSFKQIHGLIMNGRYTPTITTNNQHPLQIQWPRPAGLRRMSILRPTNSQRMHPSAWNKFWLVQYFVLLIYLYFPI